MCKTSKSNGVDFGKLQMKVVVLANISCMHCLSIRLPQCERTPRNGLKRGNVRCVMSTCHMRFKDSSRKTRILKTNWADTYIDVRTILKIQMEICRTVTIRSFSLVFLSGTILNKESCSKTHTTQGHSRIRILTLSSIKRLPLKTLKDPLTEHV